MADPKMREFMTLSIDDPAFQLMRIQFDAAIENIIKQMDERDVDEGTITLKVKVGKEKAELEYYDDPVEKLSLLYTVTAAITKKATFDGKIDEADDFYFDSFDEENGTVTLRRIQKKQQTIHEYI